MRHVARGVGNADIRGRFNRKAPQSVEGYGPGRAEQDSRYLNFWEVTPPILAVASALLCRRKLQDGCRYTSKSVWRNFLPKHLCAAGQVPHPRRAARRRAPSVRNDNGCGAGAMDANAGCWPSHSDSSVTPDAPIFLHRGRPESQSASCRFSPRPHRPPVCRPSSEIPPG